MTWKPDIFIYHDPCDDGFGAAWAVWKRWGGEVLYVPAAYGKAPPDVSGKNVLIGDFSYKAPVISSLAEDAASIVILDHHKSAMEDLAQLGQMDVAPEPFDYRAVNPSLLSLGMEGLPPVIPYFDMNKSGARLVWEFCHPGEMVPELIRYVEDRDLWRFVLPHSRAFTLYLKSQPRDFGTWSDVNHLLSYHDTRVELFREARAIERFYDQQIGRIRRNVRTIALAGFNVPAVNCPGELASDVGNAMLAADPGAPFSVTYYDKAGGTRSFSLRSEDTRVDVARIAQRFGGGGHRNAAGFEVPQP